MANTARTVCASCHGTFEASRGMSSHLSQVPRCRKHYLDQIAPGLFDLRLATTDRTRSDAIPAAEDAEVTQNTFEGDFYGSDYGDEDFPDLEGPNDAVWDDNPIHLDDALDGYDPLPEGLTDLGELEGEASEAGDEPPTMAFDDDEDSDGEDSDDDFRCVAVVLGYK